MLGKTIAALKVAEAAIQEEYEGVKDWHASGRGALEEGYSLVTGLRAKLETIEPPVVAEADQPAEETPAPETEAPAESPAEEPAAPDEAPAETPVEAPAEAVTASA